jgi:hypothetical protein
MPPERPGQKHHSSIAQASGQGEPCADGERGGRIQDRAAKSAPKIQASSHVTVCLARFAIVSPTTRSATVTR